MFGGKDTNNFDERKNVYQKVIPDKIKAKMAIEAVIVKPFF